MKKSVFFLLCALTFSANVAAQLYGRSNGVCLAQDDDNLYLSSPEYASFIVMNKETGSMEFIHEANAYKVTDTDLYPLCAFDVAMCTNGEVWYCDTYGISFYSTEDKTIHYGQRSAKLFALATDPYGNLWGASLDGHVGRITSRGDFLETYYLGRENKYSNPFQWCIRDMEIGADGTMWIVGYRDGRTTLYMIKDGEVKLLPAPADFPNNSHAVELDSDGNVWYATQHALIKYDGENFSCYQVFAAEEKNTIRDFKFDRQGRIWILPSHGYILCTDNIDSGEFVSYQYEEMKEKFLGRDGMVYLLLDGDNVYALGTVLSLENSFTLHHPRAVLVTLKDGNITRQEITEDLAANPTSIGQVGVTTADSPVFDLQGRKVDAIQHKGVYISNGKKVVR